uniref:Agenet domain-containing protein n=1 Tax=Fagus sylvatica TaxID=28930 RepID=A0A2N9GD08_FAGSY
MPRTKTQDSCFSIGDEVEVTSADHSLRGTLFPAKIIGRDWNTDKFVVEYKHLEANDEPLREEVELVLLRPLPPMPEHGYTFVFGDEVDAFFSGGWWEGVITEVDDEGSMFWVYFRFAKQQFQFLASELRIHQEWDKGTWFPSRLGSFDLLAGWMGGFGKSRSALVWGAVPHCVLWVLSREQNNRIFEGCEEVSLRLEASSNKSRMKNLSKGTPIEVSSDEDGFAGAWFAATVVNAMGQDSYLVEYKSLKTDDNKQLLREEVDIKHIRPRPPNAVVIDNFNINEEVDAFYNDGWWEGVISKHLKGSRYKVYFKGTKDYGEFHHSELRSHQDWIDGTWVMASQALKF